MARSRRRCDGTPRAGFCLMGACQDCWVWTPQGQRLRACATPVTEGMAICTRPPATMWPMTPDLQATLAAAAAPDQDMPR